MALLPLDIETYSLSDAAGFIEEPTAPANYKDPEKIAAYVAEKRAELLTKCALDPDLCCIVAIGMVHPVTGSIGVTTAKNVDDERAMLETFWQVAGDRDFIGFNLLGFDLPVLMRRSQYLEVRFRQTNIDRYRTNHVDIMERLSFNGKLRYRSLDFYCKRFKVAVEDATSGKDIDTLVKAGDWTGVAAHCRADVEKTQRLGVRLGLLSPLQQSEMMAF